MDDEQLNQRIKYLVEHGGLWHDPMAELTRKMRWMLIAVGVIAAMDLVELGLIFRP